MEDHEVVSVSESILVFGQSHFIRKVAAPLHEALEGLSNDYPLSPEEEAWRPDLPPGLYASVTAISGLAAVVLFIGGWGAKKALDELYERTLKPRVHKVLDDFFQSDTSGKKYAASLLINKLPEQISILVVTVGQDIGEIELGERQVPSVISNALETAHKIAKPNTVHLYLIESGSVNSHPWIYDSLSEAMRHMNKMSLIQPVKPVRLGS